MAHNHGDDVLHLVRLLCLGDEVAPERMEVDQRAPTDDKATWGAAAMDDLDELQGEPNDLAADIEPPDRPARD